MRPEGFGFLESRNKKTEKLPFWTCFNGKVVFGDILHPQLLVHIFRRIRYDLVKSFHRLDSAVLPAVHLKSTLC